MMFPMIFNFPMIFLFDPHGFSPISQGLASAWDVPLILQILQILWIPKRRLLNGTTRQIHLHTGIITFMY